MNGRSYVLLMFLFYFFPTHFSDVCKPTFSKLFHISYKFPLTKMRGENPKFRPISSLLATYYAPPLVMWKENRKSKTIVFISDY